MALDANTITWLRNTPNITKQYLSYAKDVVLTCRVNQVFSERNIAEITIDNVSGTTSDVKEGMAVEIGSTALGYDIGLFVVRKAISGSTLYIQQIQNGDLGLASSLNFLPIGNNAYITIYKDTPLWNIYSRTTVSGTDATFYKKYDIEYTNQNETHLPCPLNLGNHRAGWTNSSDVLECDFTATIEPFNSETVSSYSWDADGGNITVGSTSTQNITVEFDPGHYLVSCSVVLSSGVTLTGFRHVFAHSNAYQPTEIITNTSDVRDYSGRQITLRVDSDINNTYGSFCIVWENNKDISDDNSQFVGFVTSENLIKIGEKELQRELILQSPFTILKNTNAQSQQLEVVSNPSNWYEVKNTFSNPNFFIFYLMYWNSTIPLLFDVTLPSWASSKDFKIWRVTSSNMYDQLNSIYERFGANLIQESNGSISVKRNINLQDTTYRSSISSEHTIIDDDLISIELIKRKRPLVGKVELAGISWDGSSLTPYRSWSPGTVVGQGTRISSFDGLHVDDQDELNSLAGNYFAYENRPYDKIKLTMAGNYDVFNISDEYILTLDIDNIDDINETNLETSKLNLIGVEKSFRNGTAIVSLIVEAITDGTNIPGMTIPIETSDWDFEFNDFGIPQINYDDWNPSTLPINYDLFIELYEDVLAELFCWSEDRISYAESIQLPNWNNLNEPTKELVYVCPDKSSPFYTTEYLNGNLGLYQLYNNSGTYEFAYDSDVFTELNGTALKTTSSVFNVMRYVDSDNSVLSSGYTENITNGPYEIVDLDGGTDYTTTIDHGSRSGETLDSASFSSYGHKTQITITFTDTKKIYGGRVNVYPTYTGDTTQKRLWIDIEFKNSGGTIVDSIDLNYTFDDINYNNWTTYGGLLSSPVDNIKYIVFSVDTGNNYFLWGDAFHTTKEWEFSEEIIERASILRYTNDDFANINDEIMYSPSLTRPCFDFDKHDIGVVIGGCEKYIVYSTAYNGSFSNSDFSINNGYIQSIVIPDKKISDNTLDNDDVIEFYCFINPGENQDATAYILSLDTSDGSVTTISDITPTIDNDEYVLIDDIDSVSISPNNNNIIFACARERDIVTSVYKIIKSDDKGNTWVSLGEYETNFLVCTGDNSLLACGVDIATGSNDKLIMYNNGVFSAKYNDFDGTFPILGVIKP